MQLRQHGCEDHRALKLLPHNVHMQYTSIATTAVLGLSIPGPRGREHRLGAMTRIRRQDEDTWRGRLKAGMGSSAPSRSLLMPVLMLLSRWAQSTGEGRWNTDTRFRRHWPQRCARTLHRLPSLCRSLAFDCNTHNVGGGRQVPLGVDAMPHQLATNPHMGVTARSLTAECGAWLIAAGA